MEEPGKISELMNSFAESLFPLTSLNGISIEIASTRLIYLPFFDCLEAAQNFS